LVERTLALTLDGTVKTQDFRYVLTPLSARRATRDVTFAWTQKRFEELTRVVPAFLRARLIRAAAAMCDASRVRDVETFFRARIENLEGAEKERAAGCRRRMRCAALSQKDAAETSTWLGPSVSRQSETSMKIFIARSRSRSRNRYASGYSSRRKMRGHEGSDSYLTCGHQVDCAEVILRWYMSVPVG